MKEVLSGVESGSYTDTTFDRNHLCHTYMSSNNIKTKTSKARFNSYLDKQKLNPHDLYRN